MLSEQQRIREFMLLGEQHVQFHAALPDQSTIALRRRLIQEEFQELCQALDNYDLADTVDALVDLIYVIKGTGVAFGVNLEECFDEVHRSNMTKKFPDGTMHRDPGGKIIKPGTYEPPQLTREMMETLY